MSAAAQAATRIEGLRQAAAGARGRLPDDVVDRAEEAVAQATQRLGLAGSHTVVALAGATGSGKSSTFNAIIGMEFSAVGVRRPTTSWTLSCVYGDDAAAEELLDWLAIPARHRLSRESMLEPDPAERELEGLVLLDLPDHDSTEASHREQMEQMTAHADLIVWVLDPQKYADAALHDRFLRPMAAQREAMLVVLNRIDEVPPEARPALVDDLHRLLAADGLAGVPVLTTSARYGDGIAELKRVIATRVGAKDASSRRVLAEIEEAAQELQGYTGDAAAAELTDQAREKLADAFSQAAGLPVALDALDARLRRTARVTDWPPVQLAAALAGSERPELSPQARLQEPEANQVQRTRIDIVVRDVADEVTDGLTPPWAAAVRRGSTSRLAELGDALDATVAGIDLGFQRVPSWWRLAGAAQWLILGMAVVGLIWFAVSGETVALILGLGAALGGIALGAVSRLVNGPAIQRRVAAADADARAAIEAVAVSHVVDPVADEVAALRRTQDGLRAALG